MEENGEVTARFMEKTRVNIEKHGFSTIGVFRAEGDPEDFPGFMYSVGFLEHEQPEMLIMGLPTQMMHTMLWSFYDRIAEGERFEAGERVSQIIRDYDVELRAMPADGIPLNVARSYYDLDELPALHVVWPDPDGHYPGHGCEEQYERAQDLSYIRDHNERGGD
jgi:Domain of unknown function (DUF4262)